MDKKNWFIVSKFLGDKFNSDNYLSKTLLKYVNLNAFS